MLHVTKVLGLVLAAAVSSDAFGGLLFLAQKSYTDASAEAKSSILAKHHSMIQKLESAMERISSRLDELEQRDDAENHTSLESRTLYATWEKAIGDKLNSIRDEALNRFANIKDEVETYVVMYNQNRIPENEAARFIEENELKLVEIVESAMSRYIAVDEIIDNQL